MDFLGVGPFEFLFILLVSILVLGPERLQQAARSLGRLFARVMAWQYQSPEAQMIQQIRNDFEQEIVDLRNELIRARKQLDIREEVKDIHQELQSSLTLSNPPGNPVARDPVVSPYQHSYQPATMPHTDVSQPHSHPMGTGGDGRILATPDASNGVAFSADHDPDRQLLLNFLQTPTDESDPSMLSMNMNAASIQALAQQLEMVMADLHTLQEQLRDRGVLDADWQMPSEANAVPMISLHHE